MSISKSIHNGIEVFTIESDHLNVSVAPILGGKIISVYNKFLQKEFLWNNKNLPLAINPPGSEYDPNFWGAIDELILNDLPETIDSISYPDHGELWTTALQHLFSDEKITVHATLELSGFYYSKTMHLDPHAPIIWLDYKIKNETDEQRHFLWKLHAALRIEPGDKLVTSAKHGKVVDPEYSRFKTQNEFMWPSIENTDASIIPPETNTMDFFYLYDISRAEMQLLSKDDNYVFSYSYDKKVFPYQWYFASYGGFLNHYTVILEPCTNMPLSVNEAIEKQQCAILLPGQELITSVRIFAGEKKNYIPLHE
ncbi:MAG: hypothetical protein ABJA71_03135 [Ginsengibacter sp.]